MMETRQETAAEYLRAAATQLRGASYVIVRGCEMPVPLSFGQAVAEWLYEESCCEEFDPPRLSASRHHPCAVAAAVLGRTWTWIPS